MKPLVQGSSRGSVRSKENKHIIPNTTNQSAPLIRNVQSTVRWAALILRPASYWALSIFDQMSLSQTKTWCINTYQKQSFIQDVWFTSTTVQFFPDGGWDGSGEGAPLLPTPSDVASLLYKYCCCVVIMMHQAVDRRGASLTEVKEYNFSEGEGKTEGLSFNRSCVCAVLF